MMPLHHAMPATDGFPLHGHVWAHDNAPDAPRPPVVIINPATSVRSRYYHRFANFLHTQGFNVITYDYRGIGGSKPDRMRGFEASWLDWGTKDFEGALQFAHRHFPGHPIQVVAHSVGGFLIGMAPSNGLIQRVFTMGAQFAHWPDYARHKRLGMYLRWHIVMPTLTALLGYFPGERLGWLEDTPKGVVQDWVAPEARFEDSYQSGPRGLSADERQGLVDRFTRLTAPTLALSVTDDPFGTVPAIHRLLRYYTQSPFTHWRIEPAALGRRSIGHFAFFNAAYADPLWGIPLAWLRDGTVSPSTPGQRIHMD
jgi:predicted alpha/beta hydrolase